MSAEPTVLLIRHGKTELNDPSNERIRGYSDVPISFEGKQGILRTAKFIKKGKFPIVRILSTPLQRGIMTSALIAEVTDAKVIPEHGLLPWNLGKLTGEAIATAATKMNYLQDFPEVKAPDGESYRDFYERWSEALEKMLVYAEAHPEETLVGVVHSRNLLALPSILGNTGIGDVPVKGGPGPESVTQLYKDGEEWKLKVIYDDSKN